MRPNGVFRQVSKQTRSLFQRQSLTGSMVSSIQLTTDSLHSLEAQKRDAGCQKLIQIRAHVWFSIIPNTDIISKALWLEMMHQQKCTFTCVCWCVFVTVYTAGFVAPNITGGGLLHYGYLMSIFSSVYENKKINDIALILTDMKMDNSAACCYVCVCMYIFKNWRTNLWKSPNSVNKLEF